MDGRGVVGARRSQVRKGRRSAGELCLDAHVCPRHPVAVDIATGSRERVVAHHVVHASGR